MKTNHGMFDIMGGYRIAPMFVGMITTHEQATKLCPKQNRQVTGLSAPKLSTTEVQTPYSPAPSGCMHDACLNLLDISWSS
jgi:hypothetical protein